MEELIRKSEIVKAIREWADEEDCTPIAAGARTAAKMVESASTVDAVRVIRCKQCDFHKDFEPYCMLRHCVVKDDGFCNEALRHGRETPIDNMGTWQFVRKEEIDSDGNYVNYPITFCSECGVVDRGHNHTPYCWNCGKEMKKEAEKVPEKKHTKCAFCEKESDCTLEIWPDTSSGAIYAEYVCFECKAALKDMKKRLEESGE